MNSTALQCPNCQHEVTDNFCGNCGQRRIEGRYTWGEIRREVMEKALGLEKGLLRTFIDLCLNPGKTANDYVHGIRKKYTSPFAYYAIAIAIMAASIEFAGMEKKMTGIFTKQYEQQYGVPFKEIPQKEREAAEVSIKIGATVWHNIRYITMALVPLYAFSWLLVTRKRGYNFIETSILALFVSAQVGLLQSIITAPLFWVQNTTYIYASSMFSTTFAFVYNYWALKGFYNTGWFKTLWITLVGTFLPILIGLFLGVTGAFFYALYTKP